MPKGNPIGYKCSECGEDGRVYNTYNRGIAIIRVVKCQNGHTWREHSVKPSGKTRRGWRKPTKQAARLFLQWVESAKKVEAYWTKMSNRRSRLIWSSNWRQCVASPAAAIAANKPMSAVNVSSPGSWYSVKRQSE